MTTAERFLELGFDGICYDIEPIYLDDDEFLDLLSAIHDGTRAHGAVVSVAVGQPDYLPGAQRVVSTFVSRYHDPTRPFLQTLPRNRTLMLRVAMVP